LRKPDAALAEDGIRYFLSAKSKFQKFASTHPFINHIHLFLSYLFGVCGEKYSRDAHKYRELAIAAFSNSVYGGMCLISDEEIDQYLGLKLTLFRRGSRFVAGGMPAD
jgi:hypothetical protein